MNRDLSTMQAQILYALECGLSYKEIATYLGVSKWAIRSLVHDIYRMMRVHSREEAVMFFRSWLQKAVER